MLRWMLRLSALCLILLALPARAVITIEITKSLESAFPIAVVPFGRNGNVGGPSIAEVVENDLQRSGRFRPIDHQNFLSQPHVQADVNFKDWRLVRADALVIGTVKALAPNKVQVDFQLFDVFRETRLVSYRYVVDPKLLRTVAHEISDVVYEQLTGERGVFNTRIAFVSREAKRSGAVYKLQVADSDGFNPQTILSSTEPILSPAWSPDGAQLAYVSFEQRRSMVYIQNVADGRRTRVAESRGINGAPAWSPDGKHLALVLSKDGNPEIYVLNLLTHQLRRLTFNPAIDTEPAWSPDGKQIVFTSDRSGGPQIYRMSAEGGAAERLTFEGDYNANASYSPDGTQLVLISRAQGAYHAATLGLTNSALQILTDTTLDESPTFAPNGRIVLYATEVHGRGVLASVSADGRVRQILKLQEGDIREPAWSPYTRDKSTSGAVR